MGDQEQTEQTTNFDGDGAGRESALALDPMEHVSALTAERDQLVQEKAELHDMLLRRQAEFDNYRKRSERERSEFFEYAGMETVRPLLSILDDFERALKAAQTTETAGSDFVKGVELIYNRLFDTLQKAGLEPVAAVGKPFDPNVHNAVQRETTDEAEDGTVLEEYQRGYNFKGRLLRPSMVKVAVRS